MNRDLSIALAGLSLPILCTLMARWEQTVESLRHHWANMVRLWIAVVALTVATVGGALVLGDTQSDPSDAFVVVQMLGVTCGLMYAVWPLLVDVTDDLRRRTPKRLWRLLSSAASLAIPVAVVVLAFTATTAWWHGVVFLVFAFGVVPPLLMLWEAKARPALVRYFADEPDQSNG